MHGRRLQRAPLLSWYALRTSIQTMSNVSQQDFLKAAKDQLGLTWDELAAASGINARALKTYRMPDTSKDFRHLPDLARAAISRLLEPRKKGKMRN